MQAAISKCLRCDDVQISSFAAGVRAVPKVRVIYQNDDITVGCKYFGRSADTELKRRTVLDSGEYIALHPIL